MIMLKPYVTIYTDNLDKGLILYAHRLLIAVSMGNLYPEFYCFKCIFFKICNIVMK